LDEANTEVWDMYLLVRNQIKLAPMGEIIGLDYGAVLDTIKLYATNDDVKKLFEQMLCCHRIEEELMRIRE